MKLLSRLFGKSKRTVAQNKFRPVLEYLDNREVPAVIDWGYTGAGPGDFNTAANWVGGVVPGATDDIHIPVNTGEMKISQVDTVNKINVDAATANWIPDINDSGGLLSNGGITAQGAKFYIYGVLGISGGTTQTDGSSFIGLNTTQPWSMVIGSNATWNIRSTVETLNGVNFVNYGQINAFGASQITTTAYPTPFTNNGTISIDKTSDFGITSTTFTNNGIINLFSNPPQQLAATLTVVSGVESFSGGSLNLQGCTRAWFSNPSNGSRVNLTNTTVSMYNSSSIVSDNGFATNNSNFLFNTTADNCNFYIKGNLQDNGSTFTFNGFGQSTATVNTNSIDSWSLNNTILNVTLDENSTNCSRFLVGQTIVLSGNVGVNVHVVNPANNPPLGTRYQSFLISVNDQIVGTVQNVFNDANQNGMQAFLVTVTNDGKYQTYRLGF